MFWCWWRSRWRGWQGELEVEEEGWCSVEPRREWEQIGAGWASWRGGDERGLPPSTNPGGHRKPRSGVLHLVSKTIVWVGTSTTGSTSWEDGRDQTLFEQHLDSDDVEVEVEVNRYLESPSPRARSLSDISFRRMIGVAETTKRCAPRRAPFSPTRRLVGQLATGGESRWSDREAKPAELGSQKTDVKQPTRSAVLLGLRASGRALRSCRARAFAHSVASPLRTARRRTGHGHGTGSGQVQPPDTGTHPTAGVASTHPRIRVRPAPGWLYLHLRCVASPHCPATDAGSDAASLRVPGGPPLRRLSAPPGDGRRLLAFRAHGPSTPDCLRASRIKGVRRAHPLYHGFREFLGGRCAACRACAHNSTDYDFASAGCCCAPGRPREAFPLRRLSAPPGDGRDKLARPAGPGQVRRGRASVASPLCTARRRTASCLLVSAGLASALSAAVQHLIPPGLAVSCFRCVASPHRPATDGSGPADARRV